MDITALLIQLVSGAIGGNVAGAALKKYNLGTLGNSIAGILGGGIGGQLLAMLGAGSGGTDIGSIVSSVAGGGLGGGVLMIVVGLIKQAMSKSG